MTRALRTWFRTITDIRREEVLPGTLMFLYGFAALTSYYIAKSVRNAVFVERVGADALPYVYILTAVFVTLVMLVYSRYVDRIGKIVLIQGTFAVLAVILAGFGWILHGGSSVLSSGSFYIFIKLYPLLLVSQFWLVGNLLFTTRQAKRLFGPIGVGLILGAISGGTVASQAVDAVGSENLLVLAAGVLFVCSGVVAVLHPRMRTGEASSSGRLIEEISGDALKLLRDSSHLRTIAWILGLTIVVSTLIDWQLNRAVELFLDGEDDMTAFWGTFFAVQNVASVAIQVLVTTFVLRRFGVGAAMLALPLGLLVASLGVLVVPALLTVALAKGTEGALRYSLDQSTRELLFLPVHTEVKYKVKPLIDLAVYRLGTGVGGVLILVLHNGLGLDFREVSVMSLALVGLWMAFTVRMQREFRSSIRRLIGLRDVELDELIVQRLDARTLEELRGALRGDSEEEILYALSLLEYNTPPDFQEDLVRLLRHDSSRVRSRTIALLRSLGREATLQQVEPLLEDSAVEVRAEAIQYVCEFSPLPTAEQVEGFLRNEREEIRSAAIGCLVRHGEDDQVTLGFELIRQLATSERPEHRRDAARLLGDVQRPYGQMGELLGTLLRDPEAEVRQEALEAAGQLRDPALAPVLLELLASPADRDGAVRALRRLGRRLREPLLERLLDPDGSLLVRKQIPQLLVADADQALVDRLLGILRDEELPAVVRFHLLFALNRLRRGRRDLDLGTVDLEPAFRREIREGYRYAAILDALGKGRAGEHGGLLLRTLEQRRQEAVDRAVRVLGLRYPPEDVYAVVGALASSDPLTRSRGYELLDNLVTHHERDLLDPLANPEESERRRAVAARERFGFEVPSYESALALLREEDDFWLKLLAHAASGRLDPEADAGEMALRLRVDTSLGLHANEFHEELAIMDIVERADFLRRTPIFENLRTEDLAGIAALTREHRFRNGEVLFHEGTAGCGLFLIVKGRVEGRRDGVVQLTFGPGDTVGDLSLLDGRPTHLEAVAVEDTVALQLEREDFFNLLEDRFRVARRVLAYLAGVIREMEPESLRATTAVD